MRRTRDRIINATFLKRLPASSVIVISLVLSVTTCCVWTASVWFLTTRVLQIPEHFWGALESLSTAAAFAVAVGAGIMFLVELIELSDSRNLGIYRDVYEKMMSAEEIEARRHIYQVIPDFGNDEVKVRAFLEGNKDGELRDHVKRVLNTLDYFGFLVRQDWVTEEEVVGWMSPVVVKIWQKIGPIVAYERSQRPEEPDYYEAAAGLAHRCQTWRDRNLPARAKKISFDESRW